MKERPKEARNWGGLAVSFGASLHGHLEHPPHAIIRSVMT